MRIPKLFFLAILWLSGYAYGQNKQLLYDFTEIPQALMLNPGADVDFKWYSGIPGVSGISVSAGLSNVSVGDVFASDGLDINDKVRDRLISRMSPKDELSGTYQIELINVGYRGKNADEFYSFGIYHEGDAIGYWMKDYAILAFEGNADKLDQQFDLSHLKTRGEVLNVFHFGLNKKIRDGLTLGVRAKLYSSIFEFNSTRNKGYFVTTEGQNNLLANTIYADLEVRSSGLNSLKDANDDGTLTGTIIKRGLFGGDIGAGFDVGITYDLNEQTVFTASLLDLGFVYHAGDTRNYTLNGNATIEGIEVILPDALSDPNQDFWQNLVDEIEEFVPFEENSNNYITFRPTKLYASLRYNFGTPITSRQDCECGPYATGGVRFRERYVNGIGGQLYMINRPRGPQAALTAFYHRRIGNVLALKTTYTIDKFSYTNVGFGLSIQAGPVNLYAMADNLLAYRNVARSNYASFQLGFNIVSWGKK